MRRKQKLRKMSIIVQKQTEEHTEIILNLGD